VGKNRFCVRVNSRLTVNVGLRYDFYSNPTEAFGRDLDRPGTPKLRG
jgi:hypothetical protein